MVSSRSRLVEVIFKFSLVSHFPPELEINIKFPTCWDGVNAEDPNGNHVAYSLECDGLENDGPNECYDFDCPETHPVKVNVIKKLPPVSQLHHKSPIPFRSLRSIYT